MSTPASPSDRLATKIMIGLGVGAAVGLLGRGAIGAIPSLENQALWIAGEVLEPFGQIFLRLLFFAVVPLVFGSLALGITQLGRLDRMGPLATRTFALFALNMAVGVALGLLFMNLIRPGASIDESTRTRMIADQGAALSQLHTTAAASRGFSFAMAVDMFLPRNLLGAVTSFQILPLIVFALLVGAVGTQLPPSRRLAWQQALETINELMTRLVQWALRLAPFAVAALFASAILRYGPSLLGALLLFALGVAAIIALHLFGTMSLLLRLFTRRPVGSFFRAIRVILVTAFSTSSSNATLPTALHVTREHLGVSPGTAGFVLPVGATLNMSGTALYEGCVVLFVAQVYGIELALGQQATLLLLSVLSAVAVAGIPGGSLPLIMGLLTTFGVPAEGIALVLGIDRLLDMARTALNVGADVVTACIVDDSLRPPSASTSERPQ